MFTILITLVGIQVYIAIMVIFLFHRVVFNIPVFLCLWHVRRCWLKHLVRKVKDWPTRAAMFRTLGDIMNMRGLHNMGEDDLKEKVRNSIKKFVEEFNTQIPFIDYFRTYWEKNIGEVSLCFVRLHVSILYFYVFDIFSI